MAPWEKWLQIFSHCFLNNSAKWLGYNAMQLQKTSTVRVRDINITDRQTDRQSDRDIDRR